MINQKIFIQDLLGDRQRQYFLLVYDEKEHRHLIESFRMAKFLNQMLIRSSIPDVQIFLFAKSRFEKMAKVVNMVKGMELIQTQDRRLPQAPLQIFLKTRHSQ